MEETRADESLPWFKQRVRQPPNQLRLFGGVYRVLYPPSGTADGTAVFLGGGRPDPPEGGGEPDPQKLRLERGKEAKDSHFPLESHFFTTNFMNKKRKKLY